MRNAESKMRKQKCGMTLIGRGDKPCDRWLSAHYHTSLSNGSMVKMQTRSAEKLSNGDRCYFLTMNPLCPMLQMFLCRTIDVLC